MRLSSTAVAEEPSTNTRRLPLLGLALSLLAIGYALCSEVFPAPAMALPDSRQGTLGMVIDGRVVDANGRPCSKCRIIAYNASLDDAFSEEADQAGRFVLRNLPAGTYFLAALGPHKYLELRTDPTSIAQQTPPLTLTEGLNATNVTLVAPLPPAMSAVGMIRPLTMALLTSAAATPPPINCGRPPEDKHFNDVAVLTYQRTDTTVPDSTIISCGTHQSNLGCETATITSQSANVSCLGTQLYPEPWSLQTLVEIHGPSYSSYYAEPPAPDICAIFRTKGCTEGLKKFQSYNGTVIHECAHRAVDENFVAKVFDDLLTELRNIQAELDFCSGACNCESPAISERLQKALDRAAGRIKKHFYERTTRQAEAPAEDVECKHYLSLCP